MNEKKKKKKRKKTKVETSFWQAPHALL